MLTLRTLPIALLLLFVHLAIASTTTPTTTKDEAAETTTAAGRLVIRRRLPARNGGAGRLSLTNSRFGGRGAGPRRRDPARLLGDHFEPRFMAVERPAETEALLVDAEGAGGSRQQALRKARTANLSTELERIAGRWVDPVIVKSVETWMLKKSACPVRYAWKDIGALFWPRWIRLGECGGVPGTCSWPPGMHCVASATSTLHVLRWQCKVPKGSRRKTTAWPRRLSPDSPDPQGLKCSWIRVPYPITSGCMCTC